MRFAISAVMALSVLFVAACQTEQSKASSSPSLTIASIEQVRLEEIVASRSNEDSVRDVWRHPAETLRFFELKPDDFIVEVIPGTGWYTKIIAPYVANDGRYGAVWYSIDMYAITSADKSEEAMAKRRAYPSTFPNEVSEFANLSEPAEAFFFGSAPDDIAGQVDKIVFIRALHNYFRADPEYGAEMLDDVMTMLRPGGTIGIVQHRARNEATGMASDGRFGYMTETNVIKMFEEAGFEFVAKSEINANPADSPGPEDIVWRLPPTLYYGETNRDAFLKIGESDRMTMIFRKPLE